MVEYPGSSSTGWSSSYACINQSWGGAQFCLPEDDFEIVIADFGRVGREIRFPHDHPEADLVEILDDPGEDVHLPVEVVELHADLLHLVDDPAEREKKKLVYVFLAQLLRSKTL